MRNLVYRPRERLVDSGKSKNQASINELAEKAHCCRAFIVPKKLLYAPPAREIKAARMERGKLRYLAAAA